MKKIIKNIISDKNLPWDIVQIGFVEDKCKTCKKEPRRDGSAYCRKCANKYFAEILTK